MLLFLATGLDYFFGVRNTPRILCSTGSWSILLSPILFLVLTSHPICAGNADSPESSDAEIIRLLKEANESWLKGDSIRALPKYENLLPQIETAVGKDSTTVGLVLYRIGLLYSKRGDFDQALPYMERSLKLVSQLPDNAENLQTKAELYWGLGLSYSVRFELDRAIQAFNESLKLKEKLVGGDDSSLVQLLMKIAELHSVQRR